VTPDFDQLFDLDDLGVGDRERLRRVHDLLVAAGPPEELPVELTAPPAEVDAGAVVTGLPSRRRRAGLAALLAAAVAAACFAGGYVLANQAHKSSINVVEVVPLMGQQDSFASLRIGSADQSGNWPIELSETGLPPLQSKGSYYVLMVSQKGKPPRPCGTFEVKSHGTTTVTFSVPYRITKSTRWTVTEIAAGTTFPGHVVMTTS
jgi:hypothetical protein